MNEAMQIYFKPNKTGVNRRVKIIFNAMVLIGLFYKLPRLLLRPVILENSGYTRSLYPLLHEILYD